MNQTQNTRMHELITQLNKANASYYGSHIEMMSNFEWDKAYEELEALEQETGVILGQSPTQSVGHVVVSSLPKEQHQTPALSLNKSKAIADLQELLGDTHTGVLSWKLDGLTIVCTYENGQLQKAVTRGNGQIGEVITENARVFYHLPQQVPNKKRFVVRGEALISYEDFRRINEALPETEEPYKNPRNLCSGSVRQLSVAEAKQRHVQFQAFALVGESFTFATRNEEFAFLAEQGFTVVQHVPVSKETLPSMVQAFSKQVPENPFPTDGLVLQLNDIAYGKSLGVTSKYPRDSIAFKWEDGCKETTLQKIIWSASRTGLLNPVAIFDTVELEGTDVSRASVHNVSILKELALCPGDTISVYKANMIIPQIAENKTMLQSPVIPDTCPVCGKATVIKKANNSETLWCQNPDCGAKQIGAFEHAVCRDALNVDGLSGETLQKFLNAGLLHTLPDIFRLPEKKEYIISMEGFGSKSYQKLVTAINAATNSTLPRVLYALGIDNIGRTQSKQICNHFDHHVTDVITASKEALLAIDGIGEVIANSYVTWFSNPQHQELFEDLLSYLYLERPVRPVQSVQPLQGHTFVITGSLTNWTNRDALKEELERLGAKVSGSVSSKTSYLINNDSTSTSGKNKKALELSVPIRTEEELMTMIQEALESDN